MVRLLGCSVLVLELPLHTAQILRTHTFQPAPAHTRTHARTHAGALYLRALTSCSAALRHVEHRTQRGVHSSSNSSCTGCLLAHRTAKRSEATGYRRAARFEPRAAAKTRPSFPKRPKNPKANRATVTAHRWLPMWSSSTPIDRVTPSGVRMLYSCRCRRRTTTMTTTMATKCFVSIADRCSFSRHPVSPSSLTLAATCKLWHRCTTWTRD
uniref:Putative secreted protein n=1 Tax=Anopheles darlingi TaxID=43151 RepID=A0A2M4DBI2_ANODA